MNIKNQALVLALLLLGSVTTQTVHAMEESVCSSENLPRSPIKIKDDPGSIAELTVEHSTMLGWNQTQLLDFLNSHTQLQILRYNDLPRGIKNKKLSMLGETLYKFLKENTTVHTLYVSSLHLRDASSFWKNTENIRTLYIDPFSLSKKSLVMERLDCPIDFVSIIKKNKSIKTLHLNSSFYASEEIFKDFCKALETNETIEVLNLNGALKKEFSSTLSFWELALALEKNKGIRNLSLQRNDIGDSEVSSFSSAFANQKIVKVDLRGNDLSKKTQKFLREHYGHISFEFPHSF